MNFQQRFKIIKLLLIKNWRIRLHNKFSFILLFLIPILFSLLIVYFRANSEAIYVKGINLDKNSVNITTLEPILSSPKDVFDIISGYIWFNTIGIVYTPNNSYTENLMKNFKNLIKTKNKFNTFDIICAKNKHQFKELLSNSAIKLRSGWSTYFLRISYIFGIEFELDNNYEVPKHFKYKISVSNKYINNVNTYRTLNLKSLSFDSYNEYLRYGFIQIQTAIDLAHISLVTDNKEVENINIFIHKMPIPERNILLKIGDQRYSDPMILLALLLIFNLLVMLPVIVKRIVEEKSTKIADYLVILGVGKCEHWISVIIDAFVIIGLQNLIIAFILDIKVFKYVDESGSSRDIIDSHSFLYDTDFSLYLVFLFIYIIQSILFVCFISVFFRSPNISVIATILLWILTFIITVFYLSIILNIRNTFNLNYSIPELLSCLIPNSALIWFFWITFGLNQNAHSGASWSHIWDAGYLTDTMALGHVMIVMFISYPIYGILIWYLSSVIPFKHTIVKPFYFPVKYIYNKIFFNKSQQNSYQSMIDRENYSIVIKNLSKEYKSMFGFKSEKVLKNIDLEVEDKSITVILGPNGSGKTTLINIITGLIESNDEIIIGGNDMRKERQLAQNVIGFCPQENVFYKFLTVKEHLELFYELKTTLRERSDGNNCQQLIQLLDLKSDENKEAYTLSGGTMRRLVLGMALIGPNDVLLLDEPTAGLDPKVMRKVWDLLIDLKTSKSVLITSHHLSEANLLSDVIVIIANGEIRFRGSTFEMKKDFNSGYQLTITKNTEFNTESDIRKIVAKHVNIKDFKKTDIRDNEELKYWMSFDESQKFSQLFDELESNASVLAINNISLGMTTLEDSYARILHKNEDIIDYKNTNSIHINDTNDYLMNESMSFERIQKPLKLIIQQFIGIFVKRFNYLSKHYTLLITLIIIPIFFISLLFIAIEIFKYMNTYGKQSIILRSDEIYGNNMKAFIAIRNSSFETNFMEKYSKYLEESNIEREHFESNNNTIQESLLLYSEKSLLNYFHNLLYGISTYMTNNTLNLIVWHNYVAFQSLPISLNLMTNALLRELTNDNSYEITVSNSPLQIDSESGEDLSYNNNYIRSQHFLTIDYNIYMFGFTFTFASYVLLPISELRTKFKLLQLMSGLNPIVYWISNFAFDLTIHAICSLLYASVYHIFDSNEFFIGSKYSLIATYMTFLLYGFSFIPFAYLISFFCKKPSTGFAFISLYNIIAGIIVLFVVTLIEFVTYHYYNNKNSILDIISELLLILCPIVLFLNSVNVLHKVFGFNTFCQILEKTDPKKRYCDSKENSYNNNNNIDSTNSNSICCTNLCSNNTLNHKIVFPEQYLRNTIDYNNECHEWQNPFPYLTTSYIRFIFYGFLYFAIILIIEMKFFQKIIILLNKIRPNNNNNNNIELEEYESEEVKQESLYVSQLVRTRDLNTEAFVVHKLSKQFKNSLIIPNKLSFTVHKEQCFGLLGINGSGKTTTFRLITGDLSICSGNAFLDSNVNLLDNKREFYSRIGYCPQNDALLDRLTGTQTLKFFGRLRGINSELIEKYITNIVEKFDLKNIINNRLSVYSGGNRRKISLAIALIGSPSLLLLDEPTTGVDPDSRLKIWQFLRDLLINYKTSILLTSHNMSECEALCSRLGIISNGVLKTIGFINDLKNSYAKGFNIILKVNINSDVNSVECLKSKFLETFGDKCILNYENFGVFYYHLISDNIKLSQIFTTLEKMKYELNLEDYFVSNASLEQTFLSIVG